MYLQVVRLWPPQAAQAGGIAAAPLVPFAAATFVLALCPAAKVLPFAAAEFVQQDAASLASRPLYDDLPSTTSETTTALKWK